jgi:hypothetical protein
VDDMRAEECGGDSMPERFVDECCRHVHQGRDGDDRQRIDALQANSECMTSSVVRTSPKL